MPVRTGAVDVLGCGASPYAGGTGLSKLLTIPFSRKPLGAPLLSCTPATTEPNDHHHFVRMLIANRIRPTAIRLPEMTTDSIEKLFRLNPSMLSSYRNGF
jgi:hypothetical protein